MQKTPLFFRLLHLSDSALPVGGFAFSNGLESLIHTGFIHSKDSLKEYLEGYCRQILSFDLYFAQESHALDGPPYGEKLKQLNEELDTMTLIPSMRKASLLQGKNWLRILGEIFPEADTASVSRWFSINKLPAHSSLIVPLCFKRLGISWEQTKALLLYQALRDQISAAIRLNVIGPLEGHRLQTEVYEENFGEISEQENSYRNRIPFKSACLLEISQANHERLYSKLFQN